MQGMIDETEVWVKTNIATRPQHPRRSARPDGHFLLVSFVGRGRARARRAVLFIYRSATKHLLCDIKHHLRHLFRLVVCRRCIGYKEFFHLLFFDYGAGAHNT